MGGKSGQPTAEGTAAVLKGASASQRNDPSWLQSQMRANGMGGDSEFFTGKAAKTAVGDKPATMENASAEQAATAKGEGPSIAAKTRPKRDPAASVNREMKGLRQSAVLTG